VSGPELEQQRQFSLDVLSQPPASIPEALDRYARLEALSDRIGTWKDGVRGWIDTVGRDRQKSDGAFNVPIKGVGQTYLDQPEGKLRIVDVDACADWLQVVAPRLVTTVVRPKWPDVAPGDDTDEVLQSMRDAVDRGQISTTIDYVIDETAALALAAKLPRDGDTTTLRYVDVETGEMNPTGIVYEPPRDSRLTIKPDKTYVHELGGLLDEILP
jgi:hypothetical protein